MSAFSEKSLFEQGMTGSFYATGSHAWIGDEPGTFVQPLRNKHQIRMSFPVRTKIKMLPNSSSIYYFDLDSGQWNIPSKSVTDHAGPSAGFAADTRYTENISEITFIPHYGGTSGSIFAEDEKWFDTHGNSLGSGSLNIFRVSSIDDRRQKLSEESYSSYNGIKKDSWPRFLTLDMPKSVQRSDAYKTKKSECFILPINEPFLIEKVVFEIPFCFGNGWFNDRTCLTLMTSSRRDYTLEGTPFIDLDLASGGEDLTGFTNGGATSCYNFGGPGITLALFSEKNYGTGSIRDLVCRSFITHEEDSVRDMRLVPIFDESHSSNIYDNAWIQMTTLGHDRSVTKIDATVSASYVGSKKFFTGSVILNSDVEISNGVRIIHERQLKGSQGLEDYNFITYDDAMKFVSGVIESEYSSLDISTLTGVDAFGRGMTGFSPSGGSIFGSEYTSVNTEIIRKDGSIRNPSKLPDSKNSQILSEFSSSYTFYHPPYEGYAALNIVVPCYYFLGARRQSPYLINPGEKLSLAIVKNRPAILNFKADIPDILDLETGMSNMLSSSFLMNLGDSLGHDVQLNTGSINITLYGSYVREGKKYTP